MLKHQRIYHRHFYSFKTIHTLKNICIYWLIYKLEAQSWANFNLILIFDALIRYIMRKIFSLVLFTLAFMACQEVYKIPPQSQVQIRFYNSETEDSQAPLLSIKGVNNDSIWMSGVTTSSFVLPLGTSGKDQFILLIDSITDVLEINYTAKLDYESMSTGFYYDYNIQSVRSSNNKIDFINLIDTVVIDSAHENIQIFINNNTGFTSN